MNIIDILILLVLFISIAYGFYRGSVATLLGLAGCLAAFVFAYFAAPYLAAWLGSNRGVTELLVTYTDAGSLVGDYSLATTQVATMSESAIQTVLKSVSLPSGIAAILRNNLAGAAFASVGMTTVNDYVSYTIVAVVLQSASFVCCFFAAFIAAHALISLVSHVFHFSVLKHFDGLMGGVFGLLRGALVLYVLFLMLPVVTTVIPLDLLDPFIEESSLSAIFALDSFFTRIVTGG